MSWFNKEFKYNFFAELLISSMCLILASCTINKAHKRDKGVTQFQTWGHTVTQFQSWQVYMSALIERLRTWLRNGESSCLRVRKRSAQDLSRKGMFLWSFFFLFAKERWTDYVTFINCTHEVYIYVIWLEEIYLVFLWGEVIWDDHGKGKQYTWVTPSLKHTLHPNSK